MSLSFGIALYSVYKELEKDYLSAIEKIAEIGYKNVELLAFNHQANKRYSDTIPLQTMKRKFEELNLNIISTHETIPFGENLLDQDWDFIIKYNCMLGCTKIVIPALLAKGIEGTKKGAEQLNILGKKCKDNGMELYLHTHSLEFQRIGNTILFDILVGETDPNYLKFEVDMAWTLRAGIDPVLVLERLGPRCDMVHQKDISKYADPVNLFEVIKEEDDELGVFQIYRKYVKPNDFVNLGEGIFDFETVYKRIKEMGYVRYTFVENEGKNVDRFESALNDFNLIKRFA